MVAMIWGLDYLHLTMFILLINRSIKSFSMALLSNESKCAIMIEYWGATWNKLFFNRIASVVLLVKKLFYVCKLKISILLRRKCRK